MKTIYRYVVELVESTTPRILALSALAVLTVAGLAGCQGGDRPAANLDPTGVYTLISVDGKAVPCEVLHGKIPMAIKADTFTINADGTCHSLMRFSVAGREDVSREVKAAYSQEVSQLTMKWERAGTTIGNVAGNTFTMTNEGMVLSYRK